MRNQKYLCIAVKKPSLLLEKFYQSTIVINIVFSNYFWNFLSDEINKKYEKICKNHERCEVEMSKKFESVFNEDRKDFTEYAQKI